MATIALYAGKINNMPGFIKDVKSSVGSLKSEFIALKSKSLQINKSICNIDDVISTISSSTQTQDEKIAQLEIFQKNCEQFIEAAAKTDSNAADTINKLKTGFYDEYYYLKPECEKNGWEKFKDDCRAADEWCKEHWKLIATVVAVVIAVVALVVITVVTAGAALGPILTIVAGVCKGIITGAVIGGLMGGLSSAADGESFWAGFEDGAFSGMIAGAIFGGIGGSFQALGSSCSVLSRLGLAAKGLEGLEYTSRGLKTLKIVSVIANISGYASLGMFGFDFLARGAGAVWGRGNAFTAFNTKLHESSVYNGIQLITGITALAGGGFARGMRNPVCFVAGTLVLTPLGLVAIEKIKVGDKVLSTDTGTKKTSEKTVAQTFVNSSSDIVHITVCGEEIVSTSGHKFYVPGFGWVPACKICTGTTLVLADGSYAEVETVKEERLEAPVNVYNFEVEDWHTYHVGTYGVLVHNMDCFWDSKNNRMHGNLPSKKELDKLQPKQLAKLAEQLKKSIDTRDGENAKLGDKNGRLREHEFRIEEEMEVLNYIRELLEDLGW